MLSINRLRPTLALALSGFITLLFSLGPRLSRVCLGPGSPAALALLASLILAAVPTSPSLAATEFEDSVPLELVQALIGGFRQQNAVIYSDVAEEFPPVQLPDEYEVLGSLLRPGVAVQLVLSSGEAPEATRESIVQMFTDSGWEEIDGGFRPIRDTGFVTNVTPPRPSILCHEDYGQTSVSVTGTDSGSMASISTALRGGRSTCDEIRNTPAFGGRPRPRQGPSLAEYMPRLVIPESAETRQDQFLAFGGMSGSSDEMHTDHTLVIDWELDRVYQHFADQLLEQSWGLAGDWSGDAIAGAAWRHSPGTDVELAGVLMVAESIDEEETFNLDFWLIRM